jgi:hypothetical protein
VIDATNGRRRRDEDTNGENYTPGGEFLSSGTFFAEHPQFRALIYVYAEYWNEIN